MCERGEALLSCWDRVQDQQGSIDDGIVQNLRGSETEDLSESARPYAYAGLLQNLQRELVSVAFQKTSLLSESDTGRPFNPQNERNFHETRVDTNVGSICFLLHSLSLSWKTFDKFRICVQAKTRIPVPTESWLWRPSDCPSRDGSLGRRLMRSLSPFGLRISAKVSSLR